MTRMFKQIILDNFRSFKHIEIDLTDGKTKKSAKKYALIYGENGSGKTNIIESVSFLKDTASTLINLSRFNESRFNYESASADDTNSISNEDLINMTITFASMKSLNKTLSNIKMIDADGDLYTYYKFEVNGVDIEYEMRFSDQKIIFEKLRTKIDDRNTTVYEIGSDGKYKFSKDLFNNSQYKKKIISAIKQYWGNHTFLSIMNDQYDQNNFEYMISNSWAGFGNILRYLNDIIVSRTSSLEVMNGLDRPFLRYLGKGTIPVKQRSELEIYERALDDFFTRLYSDVESVRYAKNESSSKIEYELMVSKRICGKVREIPISQESSGTLKLLDLVPIFLGCASGRTAFIDELDTSIHDKLMSDLMAEILPSMKGQLIATTHNTSLIQNADPKNILIIVIDKDNNKAVRSLYSMKRTQANNNNRDRYLRGEFDGIPIIGLIDIDYIAENVEKKLKELK